MVLSFLLLGFLQLSVILYLNACSSARKVYRGRSECLL